MSGGRQRQIHGGVANPRKSWIYSAPLWFKFWLSGGLSEFIFDSVCEYILGLSIFQQSLLIKIHRQVLVWNRSLRRWTKVFTKLILRLGEQSFDDSQRVLFLDIRDKRINMDEFCKNKITSLTAV